MARYISPQDHLLAQKYQLGTPLRKFRFDAVRTASWFARSSPWLLFCLSLLGCLLLSWGAYGSIITTIWTQSYWMWLWLLAGSMGPLGVALYGRYSGKEQLRTVNVVVTLLSLSIIFIYSLIFLSQDPFLSPLPSLLGYILLCSFGYWLLLWNVTALALPHNVLICTDGCLVNEKLHRVRAVRWEQVQEIWNLKRGTRIVDDNKKVLNIYSNWPYGYAIRDMICNKVVRHIRLRAMNAYEAGDTVCFGRYTITNQGVHDGLQLYPWHNIRECEYMEEAVALIGRDSSCLTTIPVRTLPNVVIFVTLVRAITQARAKETFPK